MPIFADLNSFIKNYESKVKRFGIRYI